MVVSEHHSAFDRGQIPAHALREVSETRSLINEAMLRESGLIHIVMQFNKMLLDHYMSYDKVSRPFINFELPPVLVTHQQFSKHVYYQLTRFWPEQVEEICNNLILIPDTIRCRRSGCSASKSLSIFVMLRRLHICDTWESVARDLRRKWSWCVLIYHEIFRLLVYHYRKCVRVLDYRRINPLVEEWGQTISAYCGCDPNVIFFTDGKPWKLARPGRGWAVKDICLAAGCADVNLMQRAFYNRHYRYQGGKSSTCIEGRRYCVQFYLSNLKP
jgi:hypothetical protein